jgi:hypothetical protein
VAVEEDRGNTGPMDSVSASDGHHSVRLMRVERVDRHPWWTTVALVTAVMIVVLAVVGLPPIDLHGPLHYLGIMDPLCGGTRSVYLTTHGQVAAAIQYNPAAPLVPLLTLALLARAFVGRVFGYWITPTRQRRAVTVWSVMLALVALVALEINQQLHAGLLTSPWPA